MKIIVDIDDVLTDSTALTLKEVNKRIGSNFRLSDIQIWNQPLYFREWRGNLGEEMRRAFTQPDFIKEMPVNEAAKECLYSIAGQNTIIIATSRWTEFDGETKAWLKDQDIPFNYYVNTSETGKGILDGDLLVDDRVENLIDFLTNPNRKAFIYSRPWNTSHPKIRQLGKEKTYNNRIFRVSKWIDIINQIDQLY